MKRLAVTILCWLALGHTLYAQLDKARYMPLHRTASGHYAFSTLLNDKVMSQVMIESGIYAAIIDSAFFFRHQKELGLEALPNDKSKEMNLGGKVYRITHRIKGRLPMGNTVYKGEISVLADYVNNTPLTLPIQNLHHRNDWSSRIVMLDLDGGKLQMLTRNELRQIQGRRYKMNRNTYGRMPAIRESIVFGTTEGETVLSGNFNIDLGNPMLLYLREQSTKVTSLLNEEQAMSPTSGTTRSGHSIRALCPQRCSLLGYTFETPIICITDKLPRFTTEGLIGLLFFKGHITVFDFENNYLYMQE